ncbi:type I restriction endonuclease subunit R [uncultured Sphaerochaeta sp.]|uniref:type I restriction endonuclease subunit R n=1 Tax=uncultured Sphaerochaeta sp. TaxID=886478 RepID=UPI002A0A3A87|nr:type I restriction endonuclease subunit R [uncultured Sphaerochaeta sp.]
MNTGLNEADVENIAISLFKELGYSYLSGPNIAPDTLYAERVSYNDSYLPQRLLSALVSLNPGIPTLALEDAAKRITRTISPSLLEQNHAFHRMLVDGVPVSYRKGDRLIEKKAHVVDFFDPSKNDWLVVNQFTIIENKINRRPDLLVFLNGLPIAIFELKNPSNEKTTIWNAFDQIQTYKYQLPSLFNFNCLIAISDGLEARLGSLTSDKERFSVWKTIEGENLAPSTMSQMEVLIKGVFEKKRLLAFIKYFIVFESDSKGSWIKKISAYHQYHAVNTAVEETLRASTESYASEAADNPPFGSKAFRRKGDKRIGVVWHTTGSGKSLSMVFYAGKIIQHPQMENPTIVVITDRNDLDNQLFQTFSDCSEMLRQTPVQADSREKLKELLRVASGGVVFSTIQKFMPEEKGAQYPVLSNRWNIVVIADEAHRSQYDFIDGYARNLHEALPNASFIGFTGTPIELADKNTKAVFGDYISIYDIQRAVEDHATVPIYYESRLAKLILKESEKPHIDSEFEEITESEEVDTRQKLKSKWAALESLVGSEQRLNQIAKDLVSHWESRLESLNGKAMIVCMSRRICVEMYNKLTALRPEWASEDDDSGVVKVVMTGSASDELSWQQHIRNGARRKDLAHKFKDSKSSFKIVIVRDMWLTGFDVPELTTMYIDKPMAGHGLMQAISRVNRVFKDKPGGLVVDYIGIADSLKLALNTYAASGGKGNTAIDKETAVAIMMEKYEIVCDLLHGFDWADWFSSQPSKRLGVSLNVKEFILAKKDGKKDFLKYVTELSQAFALSVPHEKTTEIRDDVAFFQAVRSALAKETVDGKRGPEDIEFAIKQLVSDAVSADGVVDVFTAAGLNKPNISILTDEFLAEVKGMPQKNLAVELLTKLLKQEIKDPKTSRNVTQAKAFSEMLEASLKKYESRAIETAQVIEELIALGKDMREARKRGASLGLNDDEIAFYDSLGLNESAVRELGDDTLKAIARELVKSLKANLKIDWAQRESVRAQIRIAIKRILKRYKYPPDKQERAIKTVIDQAEELYGDWIA